MSQEASGWMKFVGGFRILTTRIIAGAMLLALLFASHRWEEGSGIGLGLQMAGLLLIIMAMFGRLWCALFIGGYKTRCLIVDGPYSTTRNPLYFFSFLGALGIAASTQMLSAVLLIAVFFAFYYPTVIRVEEKKLRELHGQTFVDYCQRVPSFFPKLSLLKEPEYYSFNTRLYRRTFKDCIWFAVAYVAIQIIGLLQAHHWLPVLMRPY